jgi:hypothetical protein
MPRDATHARVTPSVRDPIVRQADHVLAVIDAARAPVCCRARPTWRVRASRAIGA